jgi:tripartite-type tricarboxylate transporter receptor subunit TctC
VVVENRPGAGGSIGSDLVAKSAPDGHTLLLATTSTHAVGPALSKLPYDPLKDFTPITLLAYSASVLVVSAKFDVKNVPELIAMAKAKPGTLSFASSGNGTVSHLSGEMFKQMAGVDLLHVPYKGTGLSIPDIASGQVTMLFDNIVSAQPHLKSGTVKPLAVTSLKPTDLLPGVPTLSDSALPGFESGTWFGFFGPAGLPAEIQNRVHEASLAALNAPDARERLLATGAEPLGLGAEGFARQIRADLAKWTRVVQVAKVKAQ